MAERTVWSQELIARVEKLYNEGLPVRAIQVRLGLTESALINRLRALRRGGRLTRDRARPGVAAGERR